MSVEKPRAGGRAPEAGMAPGSPALDAGFAAEVAAGLQCSPKQLPPAYLHDALGSALFEAMGRLPWNRAALAELALLARHARAILKPLCCPIDLVALGCGGGTPLATLIEHAAVPVSLVQLVDLSPAALATASARIEPLTGRGVVSHRTTYEDGLARAPAYRGPQPLMAVLPGATLGAQDAEAGVALLRRVHRALAPGDALLLAADLVKPESELRLACDDPLHVTAAFNRNLLRRINDELGGTFDLDGFVHEARWNASSRCVEMHLVSRRAQRVRIAAASLDVAFGAGESIRTARAYKYGIDEIVDIGLAAGFSRGEHWIDDDARFVLTRFSV